LKGSLVIGGLLTAALAGVAGIVISTAASSGEPVPTPTEGVSPSRQSSFDPAAVVGNSSPAPVLTTTPTAEPISPAPTVASVSGEVTGPAAATVSVLGPDDPGFGWPTTAFGTVPEPAAP
jgi:hypothetical protein